MKTTIDITTQATVCRGNLRCRADTNADDLTLSGEGWSLRVAAADVPSVIEVLGGAYDWRKRKLMETKP